MEPVERTPARTADTALFILWCDPARCAAHRLHIFTATSHTLRTPVLFSSIECVFLYALRLYFVSLGTFFGVFLCQLIANTCGGLLYGSPLEPPPATSGGRRSGAKRLFSRAWRVGWTLLLLECQLGE